MLAWIVSPFSNIYGPLQGAARLYSYIKKAGHSVEFKDFNQTAFFKLLSRNYLEDCFDKLNNMLFNVLRTRYVQEQYSAMLLNSSYYFFQDLIQNKKMDFNAKILSNTIHSNQSNSCLFFDIVKNKDQIINKISAASKNLDNFLFSLEHDDFLNNLAIILCGKAIYDCLYFPTLLDFGLGFFNAKHNASVYDIIEGVHDIKHNYLINYYRNEVLPLIDKEQPKIVGISITHSSEIIPAFTLGNLIKARFSDIHICIGGAAITEVASRVKKNLCLWNFFDSIIIGPGEIGFSCLIEQIGTKNNLNKVPNLIYKKKNAIIQNDKRHEFNLNDACCPEFPKLRPKNPIVLETASGCYWGKCIFCNYPIIGSPNKSSPQYKVRNIELVFKDIEYLKKKYDPLYIGISDSSLHPQRLSTILQFNKDNKLNLKFTAFIRFEKDFLSKIFCSELSSKGFLGGQIGLESGSQKMNNLINKGVRVSHAKYILKNFFETGILIHLYSIVGIPTENKKEAEQTLYFIKKMHKYISLDWQIYCFTLLENSPLIMNSSLFGITPYVLPNHFLSQFTPYKVKNGISMKESLELCIEYNNKLNKYLHPFSKIMDVESYKQILFIKQAQAKS
jgi:anaerobic magnesium-protoporphyrin IX monomethyl ester cyclase